MPCTLMLSYPSQSYWFVASGCTFTLMPLLAHDKFDLDAAAIGGCFALMSLINVFGSLPASWISDKFGRKVSIVPASLCLSSAAMMFPFAQSYEQFMGLIVLWASGATFLGTAPTAFVSDINSPDDRAQALALHRSAGDLGMLVGAGSMGLVADQLGLGAAFCTGATVVAMSGMNFAFRAKESVVRDEKPDVLKSLKAGFAKLGKKKEKEKQAER